MTLLVISPDYASHAIPLLAIADAWHRRGERVVVASGPAMAPRIRQAGMEHTELIMSRGSNAGMLRNRSATDDEARSMAAFVAATHRGALETLRFQAQARSTDLLWRPRPVAERTMRIVDVHAPDTVLVDHLAFAATIGLRAMGVEYGDVVLGHPTALPVGDELYGVPSAWPPVLRPDAVELETLRADARGVAKVFSHAYNDVLRSIRPNSTLIDDAFAAHGELVLYNYPAALHGPVRTARLPRHVFLGSAVRAETLDAEAASWIANDDERPLVVVSFGTFLSARADVLRRVAASLRTVDARVAIAIGDNDPKAIGPLPDEWLVRENLPQMALLEHASLLVTHGGNNSVTESLTFGVPMLVMPFSTDQFDGAAAVERAVVGVAIDPNSATRPLIAGTVRGLLERPPPAAELIGAELRAHEGPESAYMAMSTGAALSQRAST